MLPSRRRFLSALAGGMPLPLVVPAALRIAQAAAPGIEHVKVTGLNTFKLRDALYVKVTSDSGISGWGEASPNNPDLVETFVHTGMKQHVLNRNVWDAEPMWDDMFYSNHDLGPQGVLTYAIAGIDCAMWDLRGKLAGMPVYRLLGGKYRDRVHAYGSFGLGLGGPKPKSPEEAARLAVELVGRGFNTLKPRSQYRERRVDPNPDMTFACLKAIRQAVGDKVELFICMNDSYTAARAIEVSKRLIGELGLRYIEEPVSTQNLRDLAQVSQALDVPVIAGEKEYTRWQIRDVIEIGMADIVNPDPAKAGGLTEMKKIAAVAQSLNRPLKPHNTRPVFSTAAALHLMASIPNAGPHVEYVDTRQFQEQVDLMKEPLEFKDSYLTVPTRPGLGVEVDEPRLRKIAAVR